MNEQDTLIYIRGVIASMPKDTQAKIEAAKLAIEKTIEEYGGIESHGGLALTLIGAEQAAK